MRLTSARADTASVQHSILRSEGGRPGADPLPVITTSPQAPRRPVPQGVALLRATLVAGLVVYSAYSLSGFGSARAVFEDWLYDGLLAGAAALILLRGALVGRERRAWVVLGFGVAAWAAGVVLVTMRPG